MNSISRRNRGKSGLDVVEEAVHLLRTAPGVVLAPYYIGSLPFILGLLYFWADMSRSPFAPQRLAGASLGLALLFVWMKFWQAMFALHLRAALAGEKLPRWTVRRCWRVLMVQTAIQPSAALVLPLALLPVLPLAWVYAFYQNVTALADGETGEARGVIRRAYRQCGLWPWQNHALLLVLAFFGWFIILNLISVAMALPQLLKMLFGVESVYTQSPWSLLNTTFFTAIFGLAYLCVDPIIKTAYVLRCFYGESLASGEDLRVELRRFATVAGAAAAGLLLALCLVCGNSARAAAASAAPPSVSATELDQAIDDVMHQPQYTWRVPRQKIIEDEARKPGPIGRFLASVKLWIKEVGREFLDWLDGWFKKLFGGKSSSPTVSTGSNWLGTLHAFAFVLVAAVACALVIFIVRVWRQNRRQRQWVASEAILPVPDLADENVGAEQLPEDGWLQLGRELLGQGELRLALRAFYFASLAHLAARSLITIARFKSNRDYERELRRRGHALPEVPAIFGENVSVFDRVWYGWHEVNLEIVHRFVANVERIKGT